MGAIGSSGSTATPVHDERSTCGTRSKAVRTGDPHPLRRAGRRQHELSSRRTQVDPSRLVTILDVEQRRERIGIPLGTDRERPDAQLLDRQRWQIYLDRPRVARGPPTVRVGPPNVGTDRPTGDDDVDRGRSQGRGFNSDLDDRPPPERAPANCDRCDDGWPCQSLEGPAPRGSDRHLSVRCIIHAGTIVVNTDERRSRAASKSRRGPRVPGGHAGPPRGVA